MEAFEIVFILSLVAFVSEAADLPAASLSSWSEICGPNQKFSEAIQRCACTNNIQCNPNTEYKDEYNCKCIDFNSLRLSDVSVSISSSSAPSPSLQAPVCLPWQKYDESTSKCVCSVVEKCEKKTRVWNDFWCNCENIRSICNLKCEVHQRIDESECKCVDIQCRIRCTTDFVLDNTNGRCICVPRMPATQCFGTCFDPDYVWDDKSCTCTKKTPSTQVSVDCDLLACDEGFILDIFLCECIEDPTPSCKPGYVYDREACKCVCENCTECQNGYLWDDLTCSCVCPLGKKCPENFIFDIEVCGCVCDETAECEEGFFFNEYTCSCACIQIDACPKRSSWDEMTCKCLKGPDIICAPGLVYDHDKCDCVCDSFLQCDEPKIFDETLCRCVCVKDEHCTGYWNAKRCECDFLNT